MGDAATKSMVRTRREPGVGRRRVDRCDFPGRAPLDLRLRSTLVRALTSSPRSLIRSIRLRVRPSWMRGDHFGLKNACAASVRRTLRTSMGNDALDRATRCTLGLRQRLEKTVFRKCRTTLPRKRAAAPCLNATALPHPTLPRHDQTFRVECVRPYAQSQERDNLKTPTQGAY